MIYHAFLRKKFNIKSYACRHINPTVFTRSVPLTNHASLAAHSCIDRQRLLKRFLSYVQIPSAADPDSKNYPSSEGQLRLGEMLLGELRGMGLVDARQDENGLVWASVPGNIENAPAILLNSHLDTSPEAPCENICPSVIEHYRGGDIPLGSSGQTIRVDDCHALHGLIGHTLVTTDGRTLLGGDDKAGVAAIMELAQHLLENPCLPHGPVHILFTCDEEIGKGISKVPVDQITAIAGYTLDGSGAGELEGENFSADQLVVKAMGLNIHPSIGKGRMVNSVRGLARLINELPLDRCSPESTDDRQGFMHPYWMNGGVGEAELRILLRDFDTTKLDEYHAIVQQAASRLEKLLPGLRFEIVRQRQYRNMSEFLVRSPMVMDLAEKAFQLLGRTCVRGAIRGGSDGAMLSEKGLPTPNLSVGQHNIHSVLEFVSLDEMVMAVEHLIQLADLWQLHARN